MISIRSAALRRFVGKRCFHTTQALKLDPKTVEEVKIPVPWGHIAGKWWRKNEGQPVLAFHGLFDNAATFDELIPLLNEKISVLALDIPGFGKSSNPPAGMSPNYFEVIFWMRYLIKHHFKWDKVSFLSHSFGSNLSFAYSGIFPDEVDKFVSIDCSRFNMASKTKYLIDDLRKGNMPGLLKKLKVPREGNYDEFLDYIFNSRAELGFNLTKRSCQILLSRDLEKIGDNHYKCTTDLRPHLKYLARPSIPFLDAFAEQIKCQMLVIKASNGVFINHRAELLEKQLELISKNSLKVVFETVEGGHHVHLENPERVAPIINNFFINM